MEDLGDPLWNLIEGQRMDELENLFVGLHLIEDSISEDEGALSRVLSIQVC